MEISSREKINLDARYRYSELLVNRLVEMSTDEIGVEKIEDYTKISRAGQQWGRVEHNIENRNYLSQIIVLR